MTSSLVMATGQQLSVLIGSDRAQRINQISEAFRSQGHNITTKESATALAQALRSGEHDIVVLDTALPGLKWDVVRSALEPETPGVPEPLDAIEQRHIAAALRFTRGNRRNAAQLLGIARSTLLAKIRKYGLDRDQQL